MAPERTGWRLTRGIVAVVFLAVACSGDPTAPAEGPPTVPRLSVGEVTVCAAHSDGTVYCWGDSGGFPPSGTPGFSFVPAPRAVSLPEFSRFARGSSTHMCVLSESGVATCWGRNSNAQLGNGSPGPSPAPVRSVVGGIDWSDVTAGRLSSCGVSRAGTGYCWGSNFAGEIGVAAVPLTVNTPTPTAIDGGLTFKSVVAGWRHACGITPAGAAYCWGENTRGQLGIGAADSVFYRTPVAVVGNHTFAELTLGGRHTCGLTVDARALCWGDNSTGQLGDGSLLPRSVPTAVAGSLRFRTISTSSGFAGGAGVSLPNAVQGGVAHTCALTVSGAAYCWGWSSAGQVGNTTAATFQTTPLPVSGGLSLQALGVGGAFSCGMRGNVIWCWGANAVGQLGDGGIANSSVPRVVNAPFNQQ